MGTKRTSVLRTILAAVAVGGLMLGAACESDEGEGDGDRTNFQSGNQPAEGQPDVNANQVVPKSGEITVVAQDYRFDPQSFSVRGGEAIKLTFKNEGGAAHSWAIPGAKNKDGKEISVPVTPGGQTAQTLEFTLESGRWPFQCTVHPDQMSGVLDVIVG